MLTGLLLFRITLRRCFAIYWVIWLEFIWNVSVSRIFIYLLFHYIMDPGKGKLKKRSISLMIPDYNWWNKVSFDVIFTNFFFLETSLSQGFKERQVRLHAWQDSFSLAWLKWEKERTLRVFLIHFPLTPHKSRNIYMLIKSK